MISKIQKVKGNNGKEKLMELRSVTNRKLQRQAMKNQLGSNRIRAARQKKMGKDLVRQEPRP
jgi:hypothetical protein